LGVSQSTVSEQLAALKAGGLVTACRRGKPVLYRVDADGISAALSELQAYIGSV
jgi:DNA-binding transcriptional ArsR family regulator